jgi:hypothetical protein
MSGSTAPPDLLSVRDGNGRRVIDLVGGRNKVELGYANIDRRFYLVVYLCEVVGGEELVSRVKERGRVEREETIEKSELIFSPALLSRAQRRFGAVRRENADDEIVTTSQMSLKCPVELDPLIISDMN